MRGLDDSIALDMPFCISDVTIPVRFALDENGLILEKMKTKENILGFFNPIPPFKEEHDHPVLCIVYRKPAQDPDTFHINYYSDSEEVKILLDEYTG